MREARASLFATALLLAACAGGPGQIEPAAGPGVTTGCRQLPRADASLALPLAIETVGPVEVVADRPLAAEARCRLLVGVRELEVGRPVFRGIERLEGERPAGKRRRVNPRYRELQARLRRLEGEEASGTHLSKTGDPAVDLIGTLLSGAIGLVTDAFAERERHRLRAELEATPYRVEEPVTARYRYEAELYGLERRVRLAVVLWDPASGRGWRTTLPHLERATLALPLDRDPRDRSTPPGVILLEGRGALGDPAGVPVRVRLSALLEALAPVTASDPGEPLDPAALRARWQAAGTVPAAGPADGPAPPPVPAVTDLPVRADPSVVAVLAGERVRALGFYVTPELVVTVAHVLPAGTLVPVESADGVRLYGLVEWRDDRRDLALLWVPRAGRPLELAGGTESGTPTVLVPDPAVRVRVGAPVVVGGRVLALVREDRTPVWDLVHAGMLRRLIGVARAAPRGRGSSSPPERPRHPGA